MTLKSGTAKGKSSGSSAYNRNRTLIGDAWSTNCLLNYQNDIDMHFAQNSKQIEKSANTVSLGNAHAKYLVATQQAHLANAGHNKGINHRRVASGSRQPKTGGVEAQTSLANPSTTGLSNTYTANWTNTGAADWTSNYSLGSRKPRRCSQRAEAEGDQAWSYHKQPTLSPIKQHHIKHHHSIKPQPEPQQQVKPQSEPQQQVKPQSEPQQQVKTQSEPQQQVRQQNDTRPPPWPDPVQVTQQDDNRRPPWSDSVHVMQQDDTRSPPRPDPVHIMPQDDIRPQPCFDPDFVSPHNLSHLLTPTMVNTSEPQGGVI